MKKPDAGIVRRLGVEAPPPTLFWRAGTDRVGGASASMRRTIYLLSLQEWVRIMYRVEANGVLYGVCDRNNLWVKEIPEHNLYLEQCYYSVWAIGLISTVLDPIGFPVLVEQLEKTIDSDPMCNSLIGSRRFSIRVLTVKPH